MTRVNTVFMSRENVLQRGPQLSAMDIQLGDEVLTWVNSEIEGAPFALPGVLVGVHVDVDSLSFDVAFEIGSTGVFVTTRNLVTRITRRDEDYEGRKVDPEQALRPPARKPSLQVISRPVNKDSQLVADEAEASAADFKPEPHTVWVEDDSLPTPAAPQSTPVGMVSVKYLCMEEDWQRFLQDLPAGAAALDPHSVVAYPDFATAQADVRRFEAMPRSQVIACWPDTKLHWRFLDVAVDGNRLQQRT